MMRTRPSHMFSLFALALPLLHLCADARAEGGDKRFPITSEMVITAMQYRQLPVEGVQIRLSAPVTALSENPMLDIQAMTMVDAHTAQLRIACRVHGECLPFYIAAKWPASSASILVPADFSHKQGEGPVTVKQSDSSAEGKLRPGSPATLLIEDAKVHIRLQVVCLEGGVTGDKVRVSTPDHKVAYKAEIVAPNLLKGSF